MQRLIQKCSFCATGPKTVLVASYVGFYASPFSSRVSAAVTNPTFIFERSNLKRHIYFNKPTPTPRHKCDIGALLRPQELLGDTYSPGRHRSMQGHKSWISYFCRDISRCAQKLDFQLLLSIQRVGVKVEGYSYESKLCCSLMMPERGDQSLSDFRRRRASFQPSNSQTQQKHNRTQLG